MAVLCLQPRHLTPQPLRLAPLRLDLNAVRLGLAAVEREAAALRTVGGDDGQCARSRPYYYWQR